MSALLPGTRGVIVPDGSPSLAGGGPIGALEPGPRDR